jgi:hypothetical protein
MRIKWQVLFCGILLFSTAAFADESFNCTFTRSAGVPSGTGTAAVEIAGADLTWRIAAASSARYRVFPSNAVFHYHVIQNTDVGLVAVSSGAEADKRLGPIVGANVIVLAKSNMALRMGSVNETGAHDVLMGSCQPK